MRSAHRSVPSQASTRTLEPQTTKPATLLHQRASRSPPYGKPLGHQPPPLLNPSHEPTQRQHRILSLNQGMSRKPAKPKPRTPGKRHTIALPRTRYPRRLIHKRHQINPGIPLLHEPFMKLLIKLVHMLKVG